MNDVNEFWADRRMRQAARQALSQRGTEELQRLPSEGKEPSGGGMLVLQLSLWPRTIGGRRGAESEAEESLRCRSHVWSRNAVSGEEAEE